MHRSRGIASLRGARVNAHWTFALLPAALTVWQYLAYDVPSAALTLLVFAAMYATFVCQAWAQVAVAKRLGVGVRDVTLLPFNVLVRLNHIAERPHREVLIFATGLASRLFWACAFALLPFLYGWGHAPVYQFNSLDGAIFVNRLIWMSLVVALIDFVPAFPSSMGFLFRAGLALSSQRVRATEITAQVGTLVCFICLVAGLFLVRTAFLPFLGVYFLIWSQQELADVRYFFGMGHRNVAPGSRSPAMHLPMDQVIDIDSKPTDPDFTGFTYNPRSRLWIEWKDGEPVSANALIGQ